MGRVGTARGKFRADSSVKWEDEKKMLEKKLEKSCADAARERMINRENRGDSLTDEVVEYYMGGRDGAAKQSAEYAKLMDDIKHGRIMADNPGNAADAARKRMLERDLLKNRGQDEEAEDEQHPDVGQDKANRRAYPAKEK